MMQELSPEMSEKERMTAAPRTVLLSEKTDRLKLEVHEAMSTAAQVVQRTVEMPQVLVWWSKVGWEGTPPHFIAQTTC